MSKVAFDNMIRIFGRAFFDPMDIVLIDYLCANGGTDQDSLSKDLQLHLTQVRSALGKLEDQQLVERKEDRVRFVREDGTTNERNCVFWLFTSCIADVLKYRFEQFEKMYKKHFHDIDIEKFTCQRCGKSFETEELYISSYENCPNCIVGVLKLKQSTYSQQYKTYFSKTYSMLKKAIEGIKGFNYPREYLGQHYIKKDELELKKRLQQQQIFGQVPFGKRRFGYHQHINFRKINKEIILRAAINPMKYGKDVKTIIVEFQEGMSKEEKRIEFITNTLQSIAENPKNHGYPTELWRDRTYLEGQIKKVIGDSKKLEKQKSLASYIYRNIKNNEILKLQQEKKGLTKKSKNNLQKFEEVMLRRRKFAELNDKEYDKIYKKEMKKIRK